jgi:hypothetical protein
MPTVIRFVALELRWKAVEPTRARRARTAPVPTKAQVLRERSGRIRMVCLQGRPAGRALGRWVTQRPMPRRAVKMERIMVQR